MTLRSSPGEVPAAVGEREMRLYSNFEFPAFARGACLKFRETGLGLFYGPSVIYKTSIGTDVIMSPRKVMNTETLTIGNIKEVWCSYDDGASYTRQIDQTGKTVWTFFRDGRGHAFGQDFESGSSWYFNDNAMTMKWKNKDGEVRFYRDGVLRWAVLLSGDTQPQV